MIVDRVDQEVLGFGRKRLCSNEERVLFHYWICPDCKAENGWWDTAMVSIIQVRRLSSLEGPSCIPSFRLNFLGSF